MRQLSSYTNIYHHNFSIGLSRQSINRCTTMQKIKYHLWSNFSGISAHTFSGHPMISRHHNDRLALDSRLYTSRNTSHLHSHLFQPSQTSRRLRQLQLALLGQCNHSFIKWLNFCSYIKWICHKMKTLLSNLKLNPFLSHDALCLIRMLYLTHLRHHISKLNKFFRSITTSNNDMQQWIALA